MKYFSTRGGDTKLTFEEAVLRGLAPNGGLYIPESIPTLPEDWKTAWADKSFLDLSFEVLSLFIPATAEEGGIPPHDLRRVIDTSYATFRDEDVTPLRQVTDDEYCLELWHGPTFAFKDVALQLLGNLFEYFLQRRNDAEGKVAAHKLTILGATSGDTGSAAIAGLRSKANILTFILHPTGRVSPIQEAQMTTILDKNVHNLAVDGTFDDCQDIVKALFSDVDFNAKHHLAAINSINWARILAQIVYYFSAYFALRRERPDADFDKVQFVVPTGNFGDILAGYFAKRLGVPMGKLVIATNENDILQRFWSTGRYEKEQHDGEVKATLSPAMDILVSSNFERLLWYLAHDTADASDEKEAVLDAGTQVVEWMESLRTTGRMEVSEKQLALARRDFVAERVSNDETKATILRYYKPSHGASYLIDPHTAVAFEAASRLKKEGQVQIILSTAHPAKFSEAVVSSIASASDEVQATRFFNEQVLPREMVGLLERPRNVRRVQPAAEGATKLEKLINSTKAVIESEGFQ